MKPEIDLMHVVWKQMSTSGKVEQGNYSVKDILSSILTVGPFYFYLVDFSEYDSSTNGKIYFITESIEDIHGLKTTQLSTINDVLSLIHPEDMPHVASAEAQSLDYYYTVLGGEKIVHYKTSYNFRMKTSKGNYELFNHQSLVLETDQNGRSTKAINIHTNIAHITDRNHYKFSLLGLNGYPSYLNIDVTVRDFRSLKEPPAEQVLSSRELEILRLLKEGYNSKQIADQLSISVHTVKTHRKNMLRKAGCTNAVAMVNRFIGDGWI